MKLKKIILLFVLFIFILFLFSFFDVYFVKSDLLLGRFFAQKIPFPAIYCSGYFISTDRYETFLNDYRIYFLFDNGVNKDKQYINSAIKKLLGLDFIDKMNKKLDVNCEKNQEYLEFRDNFYLQNNINKDIILKLKTNLDFQENKFEEYVVFPTFCRIKISEKLQSFDFNKNQRKKIDEIYSDILKNPDKFTEYSDKYNDENIRPIKKIGWLSKVDLPQSLADIIDNMNVGDISPVFQSISGFHIYKIEAIITGEKDQKFYEFSQVFLPTKSLDDYIEEYLVNRKFKVLIP
ncbi:MAG: peptidylprolyl isomerase [Patescibacteria group bacterium]|nr:peptidylprolyl isomerase [Patescibacteria group bacterium]